MCQDNVNLCAFNGTPLLDLIRLRIVMVSRLLELWTLFQCTEIESISKGNLPDGASISLFPCHTRCVPFVEHAHSMYLGVLLYVLPRHVDIAVRTRLRTLAHNVVSIEVFKRSPQPLKAGIVATAVFRRFLDFSMYTQRCISVGSVAARSACDLFRPATSPYLSPCTLAKPKESNNR